MTETKGSITWTDWRGKPQVREVNFTLDIRDYEGRMGYALLLLAANPHLTAREIQHWLELNGLAGRGRNWIQRRRRLFQPPKADTGRVNRDGKDDAAFRIMAQHSTASIRHLVRLLKESGITRGREWVRVWRYEAVLTVAAHNNEQ